MRIGRAAEALPEKPREPPDPHPQQRGHPAQIQRLGEVCLDMVADQADLGGRKPLGARALRADPDRGIAAQQVHDQPPRDRLDVKRAAQRAGPGLGADGGDGGGQHRVVGAQHIGQLDPRDGALEHLAGHLGHQRRGEIQVRDLDRGAPAPVGALGPGQQRRGPRPQVVASPSPAEAALHRGVPGAVGHDHVVAHRGHDHVLPAIAIAAQRDVAPALPVAAQDHLSRHPFRQILGRAQRVAHPPRLP